LTGGNPVNAVVRFVLELMFHITGTASAKRRTKWWFELNFEAMNLFMKLCAVSGKWSFGPDGENLTRLDRVPMKSRRFDVGGARDWSY
jgi:hypothetical protein